MGMRIYQEDDGDLRIISDEGDIRVRKEYGEYKIKGDNNLIRNLGGAQELIRTYENWKHGDEREEARAQFQRLEKRLSKLGGSIKSTSTQSELREINESLRNLRKSKEIKQSSASYSDYSSSGGGLYPGTMSGEEIHTKGGMGVLAALGIVGAPMVGGIIAGIVKENGGKGLPWIVGGLILSGLTIGATGLWFYLDNKRR